jgi:hypothetical protein
MLDWGAIGTVVASVSALGGGAMYVSGLKGRLDSHELLFIEREKATAALADLVTERHEDTKNRLNRIESKVDALVKAVLDR